MKLHKLGKLIVACEAYIIHDGKVLMHKRAEDKKKFPGFWIGPGGHVESGEDVLTTAIREVEEETGVKVKADDIKLKVLAFHHHLDREEVWMEYLFRATIPENQKPISTHEGESEWIEIAKLLKMDKVFPPSKYYFDHILSDKPGIMYNASQWSDAELVKVQSERVDKDT
ncbi:MAG: NUDIX domain-containing protein [Patescibacteria group bacterium]